MLKILLFPLKPFIYIIWHFPDKDILIDAVWKQLREIINRRLDEQLGAAVVQFSVTELFEDEDEELRWDLVLIWFKWDINFFLKLIENLALY